MDNSSHTEIYKSYVVQNGKKRYAFQRINKSSNGPDLAVIVQNNGDNGEYNVAQIVSHKNGKIEKRVYKLDSDKIPALMNANKEELIKDLREIGEKPKKRVVAPKKKTVKKSVKKSAKKSTKSVKKSTKSTKSPKKVTKSKKKTVKRKKKDSGSGFFFGLL